MKVITMRAKKCLRPNGSILKYAFRFMASHQKFGDHQFTVDVFPNDCDLANEAAVFQCASDKARRFIYAWAIGRAVFIEEQNAAIPDQFREMEVSLQA